MSRKAKPSLYESTLSPQERQQDRLASAGASLTALVLKHAKTCDAHGVYYQETCPRCEDAVIERREAEAKSARKTRGKREWQEAV